MRQFVADHDYDLAGSYAYSDSATDIPMLALVGTPVAVNPDRALKKHALANGWQARTFKNPEPLFQMPNAREVGIGAGVIAGVTALAVAGVLIARAGNRTRELHDPTAHAEILAIRAACAELGSERLPGLALYVTLEPCAMCAAAIAATRLARLYYGAADPKSGGVEHGARVFSHAQAHHCPEIYPGIAEAEAARLLTRFFADRR